MRIAVHSRTPLSVQPLELDIVQLEREMTLREFSERYRSQVPLDELILLNQVHPDQRLPRGTRVKRVMGGPIE
jgi:hypothetical protein